MPLRVQAMTTVHREPWPKSQGPLPKGHTDGLGFPRALQNAPMHLPQERPPPLLFQTLSGGFTSVILSSIFTQRWQETMSVQSRTIQSPDFMSLQVQGPQLTFAENRDREWFQELLEGFSPGPRV